MHGYSRRDKQHKKSVRRLRALNPQKNGCMRKKLMQPAAPALSCLDASYVAVNHDSLWRVT
jgi:hypothetical protein